jgi:Spy/CpxP family protein refolding chaperone
MKSVRLVLAGLIAVCFILSILAAPVQQAKCAAGDSVKAGQEKGEGPHKKWEELGLSADQKEKLKALRGEMQGMAKEHMEAVKSIREKMKAEFLKPKVDRKVLSTLIADQEKANRTFAEKRIDHLLKVKAVLTQAQFEKVVGHEFWGDRGPMMGKDKEHGEKGEQGEGEKDKD